jgi:ribosomal protein S12
VHYHVIRVTTSHTHAHTHARARAPHGAHLKRGALERFEY